jgi:hypothetical protein
MASPDASWAGAGFRYDLAEVDVIARRPDSPPKFVEVTYQLRVATGETQRRIDLVHFNLRKYGTVCNTLAAACDVHGARPDRRSGGEAAPRLIA